MCEASTPQPNAPNASSLVAQRIGNDDGQILTWVTQNHHASLDICIRDLQDEFISTPAPTDNCNVSDYGAIFRAVTLLLYQGLSECQKEGGK